jgi:F-type H+-transporting ATPase subunit gamma
MKMVAAAKLRKAQDKMNSTRPFASKIEEVAGRLTKNSKVENPVMRMPDEIKNVLFIVIGSDRGLCGGFNNNLFKDVENKIHSNFQSYLDDESLSVITIGKKATAYFKKRKYNVVDSFPGFFDNVEYAKTSEIMNAAIQHFIKGEYDEVFISYNEFKSVITQNRKTQKVLPIDPDSIGNFESDNASESSIDYLYEPDSQAILDRLLPLHLNMQLWRAVVESNASEQGARMTAMDSATENAKDLERDLRLKYNQVRQSAITTEISEIVSGAQALSEN